MTRFVDLVTRGEEVITIDADAVRSITAHDVEPHNDPRTDLHFDTGPVITVLHTKEDTEALLAGSKSLADVMPPPPETIPDPAPPESEEPTPDEEVEEEDEDDSEESDESESQEKDSD